MTRSADVLVVMARAPELGAVKTRLAERVGAAAACDLYRAFLTDLAGRLADGPWALAWAVTPPDADLTPIVGQRGRQIGQQGVDLAERMWRCVARLFDDGAARVVMIGADVPHLPSTAISAVFAALDAHDAVLMPTRDGGYCLVGLRAAHDLFTGIPMGSASVFDCTRARLAALGLRWCALDPSFDVDEFDDVVELAALIAQGDVALPHTAAVLRAWHAAGFLLFP